MQRHMKVDKQIDPACRYKEREGENMVEQTSNAHINICSFMYF